MFLTPTVANNCGVFLEPFSATASEISEKNDFAVSSQTILHYVT